MIKQWGEGMTKPNKYSNKIKIIGLIANSLSFPGFPSFPGLSYPVINNTDTTKM